MPTRLGALREARGALQPQVGQVDGLRNSAIGRVAVNAPHPWQSYSYTGMAPSICVAVEQGGG